MSNVKEVVVVGKKKDFISYEFVGIENYKGANGERFLSYGFLLDSFRKIMGKTLTIIDACIVDKTQNKAVKDIIREVISEEMDFSAEFGFDQGKLMKDIDMSKVPEGSVTIEEALGVK